MRILLINWAKVWRGASDGGGVNGYAQSLALELIARGCDVCWLSSGVAYEPGPDGNPGPVTLRRHDDWKGVRVFEVVNSPVLAPSIHQFRKPRSEIRGKRLQAELRRFALLLRPDIVHAHNIEGLTAGSLTPFAEPDGDWPGARLVYSLHNYHTICPQVYLMQGHRRPCHDNDGGRACETCINGPAVMQVRRDRAMDESISRPQHALETRDDVEQPRTVDHDDRDDAPTPITPGPSKRLEILREPLTNDIAPPSPPADPPGNYSDRRAAMIDMLNGCERVLAVSSFVHRKFESLGVQADRLVTMPIGTRSADAARLADPPPPLDPPRPIRLAFIGHNNYFKGLPMLMETLVGMDDESLARIDLSIAASGLGSVADDLQSLEPRLAALTIRDAYRPADIPDLLAGRDMGVVPSVWWDNAPQTVFELLACGVPVLGAAVGGIPDFVQDGVNGRLFRSNDRDDLARVLRELIDDPSAIATMRTGVKRPKTMAAHSSEVLDLYASLLAGEPV